MKNFVAIIFLILSLSSYSIEVVHIDEKEDLYDLNDFTYLFDDIGGKSSIEDIINLPDANWRKLSKRGPILAHTSCPQWIKIRLANTSNKTLKRNLFIPFNHIKYIKSYLASDSVIIEKPAVGTSQSYSEKEIPDRNYFLSFNIPPNDTINIYTQIVNEYIAIRAPMFLLDDSKSLKISVFNNSLVWLWRGIFIFALIISIILYFFVKLRLFLYYFLLNIGVMIFVGSEIGDFFLFFDSDPVKAINSIKYLGTILVFIFFPVFLNSLVNIKDNNPVLWKMLFWVIHLNWIVFVLSIIPPLRNHPIIIAADVFNIISAVIVFLMQLVFLIIAVKRKQEGAIFLFILYTYYITSVAITIILPNLGIGKVTPYTYNSLFVGSILEIFTFMFLMGKETVKIYYDKNSLLMKQHNHQKEMMQAVVEGQEQERNRLGSDLHDMVGGNLALIKHKIESQNGDLKTLIARTIQDVRSLSHDLVTPSIEGGEFKDEILQLAGNYNDTNNIKVNIIFHEWPEIKVKETITHIYRIVQELLQNAIKHSQANTVFLQFVGDDKLLIVYEDNGVGFDYEDKRTKGIGLQNIEYRIKVLNSNMTVESSPKSGTSIFIEIPIHL